MERGLPDHDVVAPTVPKPDHFVFDITTTKPSPTKCLMFCLNNSIVNASSNFTAANSDHVVGVPMALATDLAPVLVDAQLVFEEIPSRYSTIQHVPFENFLTLFGAISIHEASKVLEKISAPSSVVLSSTHTNSRITSLANIDGDLPWQIWPPTFVLVCSTYCYVFDRGKCRNGDFAVTVILCWEQQQAHIYILLMIVQPLALYIQLQLWPDGLQHNLNPKLICLACILIVEGLLNCCLSKVFVNTNGVPMMSESMLAQNSVQLMPMQPPPEQFGMLYNGVQLRPTPWPSFSSLSASCNAYSANKCLVQLLYCEISGKYWRHWNEIVEVTVLPSIHLLHQYLPSLQGSSSVHRNEGRCDSSFPHIPSRYAYSHLLYAFVSLLACQKWDRYTIFVVLTLHKFSSRLFHKFTTAIQVRAACDLCVLHAINSLALAYKEFQFNSTTCAELVTVYCVSLAWMKPSSHISPFIGIYVVVPANMMGLGIIQIRIVRCSCHLLALVALMDEQTDMNNCLDCNLILFIAFRNQLVELLWFPDKLLSVGFSTTDNSLLQLEYCGLTACQTWYFVVKSRLQLMWQRIAIQFSISPTMLVHGAIMGAIIANMEAQLEFSLIGHGISCLLMLSRDGSWHFSIDNLIIFLDSGVSLYPGKCIGHFQYKIFSQGNISKSIQYLGRCDSWERYVIGTQWHIITTNSNSQAADFKMNVSWISAMLMTSLHLQQSENANTKTKCRSKCGEG